MLTGLTKNFFIKLSRHQLLFWRQVLQRSAIIIPQFKKQIVVSFSQINPDRGGFGGFHKIQRCPFQLTGIGHLTHHVTNDSQGRNPFFHFS